jgi:hypothetical protein
MIQKQHFFLIFFVLSIGFILIKQSAKSQSAVVFRDCSLRVFTGSFGEFVVLPLVLATLPSGQQTAQINFFSTANDSMKGYQVTCLVADNSGPVVSAVTSETFCSDVNYKGSCYSHTANSLIQTIRYIGRGFTKGNNSVPNKNTYSSFTLVITPKSSI